MTAAAEQREAALDARAAACAERERTCDERDAVFERQATAVRDELRSYHNHLEQTHRQLLHRIMATAGILGTWNETLQDPPTWMQLRQMIVGLPDDPPPIEREVVSHPRIDIFSDTSDDPHADRQGAPFLGELTRDVSHKRKSAA